MSASSSSESWTNWRWYGNEWWTWGGGFWITWRELQDEIKDEKKDDEGEEKEVEWKGRTWKLEEQGVEEEGQSKGRTWKWDENKKNTWEGWWEGDWVWNSWSGWRKWGTTGTSTCNDAEPQEADPLIQADHDDLEIPSDTDQQGGPSAKKRRLSEALSAMKL